MTLPDLMQSCLDSLPVTEGCGCLKNIEHCNTKAHFSRVLPIKVALHGAVLLLVLRLHVPVNWLLATLVSFSLSSIEVSLNTALTFLDRHLVSQLL